MQSLIIPAGENRLEGFFHPAPAGMNRPVLIVCHGFCGSAEGGSALTLAEALQKWDIALLRFRFTPHRCLSQQVREISAVVEFCRSRISRNVALLGRSMGAAAALVFAAKDQKLAGLCLMASPADLPSTFRSILGDDYQLLEQGQPVTVFHEGEPVHLTPEFIRDFAHYDLLQASRSLCGIPLLVVHGLDDGTVPAEHGRQIFAAAAEPKQILLLPDHAHSFTGCSERFIPAITDWLKRTVFPHYL